MARSAGNDEATNNKFSSPKKISELKLMTNSAEVANKNRKFEPYEININQVDNGRDNIIEREQQQDCFDDFDVIESVDLSKNESQPDTEIKGANQSTDVNNKGNSSNNGQNPTDPQKLQKLPTISLGDTNWEHIQKEPEVVQQNSVNQAFNITVQDAIPAANQSSYREQQQQLKQRSKRNNMAK